MGGKGSKEMFKLPAARKVVAARLRNQPSVQDAVSTAVAETSAMASGREVIERGGTNVEGTDHEETPYNPEILSEMSKWHFIEGKEDMAVKKLVDENKKVMASLIRLGAQDSYLPGRDTPRGFMTDDELTTALLHLRDLDGRTLKEARMQFLSELEAYGIDEDVAIKIAGSATCPFIETEDEDVLVAR